MRFNRPMRDIGVDIGHRPPSPAGASAELLLAVGDAARRFGRLAAAIGDPDLALRGSTWTAADLVAHVTRGLEGYSEYLAGETAAFVDVSDIAGGSLVASNADVLDEEPDRDIDVLLARASAATVALTSAAAGRSLDELVPWHGRLEPLRCLLASSLAEQLIHGHDLARALGEPWDIPRREAALVLGNITPLLPLLVDPHSTRSLQTSIRILVRGADPITLTFDHGRLTVDGDGSRPDATVSADPVAFLLVAYGRSSQWAQIARGRLVAWGRRPWHALRLVDYLVRP